MSTMLANLNKGSRTGVKVDAEGSNTKPRPTPAMYDRTPQEDLLVVEALVEHSHKLEDVHPARSARAWVLARDLAGQHGLEVEDALRQRDGLEKDRPSS